MKLVIADDHKGLRAAARRAFDATHQRCRVHWMRNALVHAPAKQRSAGAAMLRTIFAQETAVDAVDQWDVVADALREKQPKLGALMDASGEDALAYMDFPREHWPQIRLDQSPRAGEPRDQAPRRRRRHLPQRRSDYAPRRRHPAGTER